MGTKVLSPQKPNLTKAQNLAIRELKRDKDCIVLTADKGVAMVIHKIHKPDTLLRPIVSSCGSVTYGVDKELDKILKPLVDKSPTT